MNTLLDNTKDIINHSKEQNKTMFDQLRNLNFLKNELENKIQLLESKQNSSYEDARLKELANKNEINKIQEEIDVKKRELLYKNDADMYHNAKIYLLGNTVFWMLIFLLVYLVIKYYNEFF
jgi:small-conductance mechanosensitive channel